MNYQIQPAFPLISRGEPALNSRVLAALRAFSTLDSPALAGCHDPTAAAEAAAAKGVRYSRLPLPPQGPLCTHFGSVVL